MAQERGDYVVEEGKELALVLGGALSWLHVHVNDAPIGKRDHGEMGATGVEGVAPPRGRLNSSNSPHGVPTGARDEHHGGQHSAHCQDRDSALDSSCVGTSHSDRGRHLTEEAVHTTVAAVG